MLKKLCSKKKETTFSVAKLRSTYICIYMYIYTMLNLLALQGALNMYDISRLKVKPIYKRNCVTIQQLFKSAEYGVSVCVVLELYCTNMARTLTPYPADLNHCQIGTQYLLMMG
jgi:hypothetical protein